MDFRHVVVPMSETARIFPAGIAIWKALLLLGCIPPSSRISQQRLYKKINTSSVSSSASSLASFRMMYSRVDCQKSQRITILLGMLDQDATISSLAIAAVIIIIISQQFTERRFVSRLAISNICVVIEQQAQLVVSQSIFNGFVSATASFGFPSPSQARRRRLWRFVLVAPCAPSIIINGWLFDCAPPDSTIENRTAFYISSSVSPLLGSAPFSRRKRVI